MNIAIIGSRGYPYVYSGYETFIKELAERLSPTDEFEITVYCHRNLFPDRPRILNGIHLVYVPTIETKSLSQFIHSFLSTLHACITRKDLLLYVNSANGPFGAIAKVFGKRTLINVDGLEWLRPKWKGLGSKYFYFASRLACKVFDVVVTDAQEMKKIYLEEFGRDSEVIAYGADIRDSIDASLIDQFGVRKNEYYLIVGRLIPDNNSDLIIREFINSNSTKRLVVVGDVPYRDEYADRVKRMKDERVIFAGYITDQATLAELYHNCYIYLHGHEYGGTNPTLLNALACGCSVLALDTRFSREVLAEEDFGQYFSKSPGSLTAMIEKLEHDYRLVEYYRSISRERIRSSYTWDKIVDQYKELLGQA